MKKIGQNERGRMKMFFRILLLTECIKGTNPSNWEISQQEWNLIRPTIGK